ncbi:MAG: hypothetical protein D6767_00730 [Candidatus Hydrogenedentota bacterium]|nr:MAG: hypothetical protein D6767_00730 [Candidatus Hydrogenedentota bacterium]
MFKQVKVLFLFSISFFLFAQPAKYSDSKLDLIQKEGLIRIAVAKNYPPLSYQKNGSVHGLEIKMGKALAKFLQVKVKFFPMNLREALAALQDGKVDLILSGLSRSLERAQKIWFSRPYLMVSPAVLVNKRFLPQTKFGDVFEEKPFLTLWDLKRIPDFVFGYKKGSVYEILLKSEFHSHESKGFSNNQLGIKALLNGDIYGFVHDSVYLDYLYEKNPSWKNRFKLLQGGSRLEHICAGLPFGAIYLKNQVDTFILEIKRTGQLDKWLKESK